jgi:1-acyl-sn-glycerol-3-phosphate acyltransferase
MAKEPPPTSPIPSGAAEALAAPRQGAWIRGCKIAWLAFWAVTATLLVFPPLTLVSLFSKTGNSMFQLARLWAWIILSVTGVHLAVQGRDNIDPSQAYMIIANHQSHFDGPALAWGLGGLQFRWIAKRELLKIPIFGHCLNSSRNIFIDRSNRETALASIENGLRRLPPGAGVMCFAEGTRSATGHIGPFKTGGFAAALRHGLPILPVTINGSRRILPKGSICYRKGLIELVIAAPLETAGKSVADLEGLIRETRRIIQASHH